MKTYFGYESQKDEDFLSLLSADLHWIQTTHSVAQLKFWFEGTPERRSGNSFPQQGRWNSIITGKHRGPIVISGSSGDAGPLDFLYRLPNSNTNEWTLMDQKLSLKAVF